MNWDIAESKWDQVKGQLRTKWGKLTDDDMEKAKGRRDQVVGRLKERYGMKKEEAEDAIDSFISKL